MPHIASQCSRFKEASSMHGFDLKALEIETAYINLLRKNLRDINKQLNCNSCESKEKHKRIERNHQNRYSQTVNRNDTSVIDLTGYLIFVAKNKCGNIRLYGSSSSKSESELEIGDEILEINGENVCDYEDMPDLIEFIHNCIISRSITLKVKRSIKINELVLNENLEEAFIIGVDEKAKERLNKLTALNKVTPIDIDYLNLNKPHRMVKNTIDTYQQQEQLSFKMSTFLPHQQTQANTKRIAPQQPTKPQIIPHQNICSLSSSRFSSTLSSTSSSSSHSPPTSGVHTSPSGSSTNSKSSNKTRPYKILTSSVVSSNQEHCEEKKYCSSSSSSVSAASTSPPPSPSSPVQHETKLIESAHREMAIDCPDYFVPEIKTRPCYPPNQSNTPNPPEHKQSNLLLKPLLNIINNHVKPDSSSQQKHLKNTSQSDLLHNKSNLTEDFDYDEENFNAGNISSDNNQFLESVTKVFNLNLTQSTLNDLQDAKTLNHQEPLISSSLSSIQYIDEDSKSKIISNTPSKPIDSADFALAQNTQQHQTTAKISLGKKLFEKQHEKLRENNFIRNSLRSNSIKHKPKIYNVKQAPTGMINNAFEMDNDIDDKELVNIDIECSPCISNQENLDKKRPASVSLQNEDQEETKVSSLEFKFTPPVNHLYRQNTNNNLASSSSSKLKVMNHSLSRPPTPPPRAEKHLSFFVDTAIVDIVTESSQVNQIDIHDKFNKDSNKEIEANDQTDLLRQIYETNNFENTLNLYNKIIKLNSKLELKPAVNNVKFLSQEAMKLMEAFCKKLSEHDQSNAMYNTTNELCTLLSKMDVQNVFSTHDQISNRFEEQKLEFQKQNKQIMLEQHQQQQNETLEISVDFHKNDTDPDDETITNENDLLISDEGRFLLSKAQHYSVENLKLVNIEKPDTPFGATIRNRDGNIVIGRIVAGGAAEQSGLLHEEDEILEINNIPVRGKTINDVCDMLADIQGIVSFLIIPNMDYEKNTNLMSSTDELDGKKVSKMLHIRALFNYVPQEDLYIPCKELGLNFSKGDILHIISQEDTDWWQAYKDDEKEQSLAGLIPSQAFQERRFSQLQALIGDSFMNRKKRDKGFCMGGGKKSRRRIMFEGINESFSEEIVTYEQVCLYRPAPNRKRPIVLIGPHSIGRHELRKRLMQSSPSLFEVAVPHTTRLARRDEIDGKDYHFLPRHIFEADIKQGRFIEHGEYEKNLYGTSYEAIKKVIENSRICVLNLYPQALKTLRNSDLMPFIIYIGPPNLSKLKELKVKLNESYKENDLLDIIDKGREIEEIYGHYFDKIIRNTDMDKTYHDLFETIQRVQNEENWVPECWLNSNKKSNK